MEPRIAAPAQGPDLRQRIDRASANRASGAHDDERDIPRGSVGVHLAAQRGDVHAEVWVRWDPADGSYAEACEVGGLLNPRVRFFGAVDTKPAPQAPSDAFLAHVPVSLRGTRGEEADEVRHVATTDEEPAAVRRVADQLGDPPHGLLLNFRGGGRQHPRSD